jgi:hypothetical protein
MPSAARLGMELYLPLLRRTTAAPASRAVREKVDWKPSWLLVFVATMS